MVAIIVLAPLVGALTLLMLGIGVIGVLVAGSWYFYDQPQFAVRSSFPLLSSLVIYVTLVFINYFREQTDRRRIRSAFGQYLSPDSGRAARASRRTSSCSAARCAT